MQSRLLAPGNDAPYLSATGALSKLRGHYQPIRVIPNHRYPLGSEAILMVGISIGSLKHAMSIAIETICRHPFGIECSDRV